MELTNDEKIKNVDEMINQYLFLIKKTIDDITILLEKRKELINKKEN